MTDSLETIKHLEQRVKELEAAIRKHRDQHGDDRCWMDDYELYAILFDDPSYHDQRLHEPMTMIKNCIKFIESRHPSGLPYVSPQKELSELNSKLFLMKTEVALAVSDLAGVAPFDSASGRKLQFIRDRLRLALKSISESEEQDEHKCPL